MEIFKDIRLRNEEDLIKHNLIISMYIFDDEEAIQIPKNICIMCQNETIKTDYDIGILVCTTCGSINGNSEYVNDYSLTHNIYGYIKNIYCALYNSLKVLSSDPNFEEINEDIYLYCSAFLQMKKDRHNQQRNKYVLHKIMQRRGLKNIPYKFSTKNILLNNEAIWQQICIINDWHYISDFELYYPKYNKKKKIKQNII